MVQAVRCQASPQAEELSLQEATMTRRRNMHCYKAKKSRQKARKDARKYGENVQDGQRASVPKRRVVRKVTNSFRASLRRWS
jgi:hypothetical protein